jgi:GT2 family glycosyltransferase
MTRQLTADGRPVREVKPDGGAVFVDQVELSEPLRDIAVPTGNGVTYSAIRLLVRLHHQPLGFMTVPPEDERLDAPRVAEHVWNQLWRQVSTHLLEDGLSPVASIPVLGLGAERRPRCMQAPTEGTGTPMVTVVVCTRDRPQSLARCLETLAEVHYKPFEVVVVDNAPTTEETLAVVRERSGADSRVRYVRELRPGLSCARNRGLQEARGALIAFTDDDVVVDPHWLDGVVRGFSRSPSVACVTGLVPSAHLENAEQRYFDRRVSWAVSCTPRRYDLHVGTNESPLYPYAAGQFGTGANFAFRTATLRELGGFDEALGAGAPAGGGEDLDVFVRTILAGYELAYEPAAIVWHEHRVELGQLRRQLFNYGVGLAAFATKYLSNPRTARDVFVRLPRGLHHLQSTVRRAGHPAGLPRSVPVSELLGLAWGPIAYWLGRRRQGSHHVQMVDAS